MLNNKKMIISFILLLLFLCIFFLLVIINKPIDIIESKLDVTLPSSSKVINFDYNGWNDNFDAKILIDKQNVDNMKKELEKFFRSEFDYKNKNSLPNIGNVVSWWDMDKSNIETCYFIFLSGKKHLFRSSPKSKEVWAFIVKQNDGQYYLYISY